MKLLLLIFLFTPAYSFGKAEVKDYCPHAEAGAFNVQKASYQNLLATLDNKKKNKKKWKKKKGSGQR